MENFATTAPAVPSQAGAGEDRVLDGVRAALPVVLGYIPLGMALGVLASANGIPVVWAVLMSIFTYSGSGQFIAVGLLGLGAPAWTIVLTVMAVNIRYLLLSAWLASRMNYLPRRFVWLYAFEITDETFAVASDRLRVNPPGEKYLWGLNLAAHLSWITSTLAGAVFGGALPSMDKLGIDFALPAMFISLVIGQCRRREEVVVAVAAGVLNLVFLSLGGGGFSLVGATILAGLAGVILYRG